MIRCIYKKEQVEKATVINCVRIPSVQSIQSTKIKKNKKISSKIKPIQSVNMKSQSTNIFLSLRQINQYSHFLLKVFGVGYCGF